jgi:hypothetical protein
MSLLLISGKHYLLEQEQSHRTPRIPCCVRYVCANFDEGIVVGIFKNKLRATVDLRKVTDRRTQEQKRRYDRRVRPDRRLSNISVEWIPFSEVVSHPTIREALSYRKNKKHAKGTPRKEMLLTCIFENQWSPIVNRRKATDRRTQQLKRPYNHRMRPDRRLNNISVEWIPY